MFFSTSRSQSRTLHAIENHRCGRLWLDDIQSFFFRECQVQHQKNLQNLLRWSYFTFSPPEKRSLWVIFHDLFMNLQNLIQCGFQKGGFTTCLGDWFLRTYNDPQTLYLLFEAALGGGKTWKKTRDMRFTDAVSEWRHGCLGREFQKRVPEKSMRSLIQWRCSVWEYYCSKRNYDDVTGIFRALERWTKQNLSDLNRGQRLWCIHDAPWKHQS